jgi:hypothetical protein
VLPAGLEPANVWVWTRCLGRLAKGAKLLGHLIHIVTATIEAQPRGGRQPSSGKIHERLAVLFVDCIACPVEALPRIIPKQFLILM